MSRIGSQPVEIPDNVTVNIDGKSVHVKGPKGEMDLVLREEVSAEVKEDQVIVKTLEKEKPAYWGLTRALIANAVTGVTEGFFKELELVGVGYRVTKQGKNLSLTLGFSHPVKFEAPEGIEFEVPDNKHIKVTGVDKQLVGLVAASIRKLRKPEPYKGKGIKYADEVVRRKPGKSLVGAGPV